MHPSHPGDPKAPRGARRPESEPIEDRPEDPRTVEVRGGRAKTPIRSDEAEVFDERDTQPPPLPVAEYVQTMMQQAETADARPSEPPSSRAPLSWRGEPPSSRSPQSWRGEPRAPASFRPRTPMDPGPGRGGLRAFDAADSGL